MPTPHSEASFGAAAGQSSPGVPVRTRLVQADNNHEVLLLEYRPELADASRYASGVVVAASVGYSPGLMLSFYGYSDVTSPTYSGSQVRTTQIVCTGATYPLRDSGVANWPDGTPAHLVVGRIARMFGMSSTCAVTAQPASPGPYNESWWAYLCRIASDLGWVMRASATDIQMQPRRIDATTPLIFRLDPTKVTGINQRILKFSAISGDTAPSARKATTATGVDANGSLINATDASAVTTPATRVRAPALSTIGVGRPITSMSDAQAELLAQRERSRLGMTAEVTVQGNAKLRNGVSVLLRDLDALHDGFWYVDRVEHLLEQSNTYRCKLCVSRAAAGDPYPNESPTGTGVWYAPGGTVPLASSATILVDGGPLTGLPDVQTGRWAASPAVNRVVAA